MVFSRVTHHTQGNINDIDQIPYINIWRGTYNADYPMYPLVITTLLATFLMLVCTRVTAETYFIDANSGNDTNEGTSADQAWSTIGKVNESHFFPGDNVLFKRGQQWRGTLTIPSSGTSGHHITFGAYGKGKNPVLMRTREFSNWVIYSERNIQGRIVRIWSGTLPRLKNSWGLVKSNTRIPLHRQYSDIAVNSILDGHFYCPLNKGRFYFRNDSGNPGTIEIGSRPEAIHIENKHYVTIDSIDAFGPGGREDSGGSTGFSSIVIKHNSSHIQLQNLSISFGNSIGVSADSTTSNITYASLSVHHNGGTGIYMNSQSGLITKCLSFDNGTLYTDKGDRGGIGSYKGGKIRIESNEVFRNGRNDSNADFEISIVGTGAVKIERNYIHDCLQGCIQVAEGGDESIIAYNVISRYGTSTGEKPSLGKFSGIRIGGGRGGAKKVRIYNNVLHGGRQPYNSHEAAIFVAPFDNSGLTIKNNIFTDNTNRDISVTEKFKLDNTEFAYNLFSNIARTKNMGGAGNHSMAQEQAPPRYDQNSILGATPLFKNLSGTFSNASDFSLQPNSPAIDKGVILDLDTDYSGNPVPIGQKPDIGAFEFQQGN